MPRFRRAPAPTAAPLPLLLAALLLAAPAAAQPVRLSMPLFGDTMEIEVRDLNEAKAEAAVREALQEAFQLRTLLDPEGEVAGGIGAINRAAGDALVPIDPQLRPLLERARAFCVWSEGAWSPTGGALLEQWRRLDAGGVDPVVFSRAIEGASCAGLQLRIEDGRPFAALAAESRLHLRGMVQGAVVDRAVEVLATHGVTNAWIETPQVVRALGSGVTGRGWPWQPPTSLTEGRRDLPRVWLRDRAVALARWNDPGPPRGDMRSGEVVQGVVATLASTTLGGDAQVLAEALYILGKRAGQRHLGQLEPRPAALWLLGSGDGPALEVSYYWSTLPRVAR